MIFSVQNNNLMFSVEILADLVQIQVRETVCGVLVAEHVEINYPETPDSRYVAQPFDDFFPWEEGSVDNPNTIKEVEGFSEPRFPVNELPRQTPVMEVRPDLRSIENLQIFENSAAPQLFDF